MRRYRIGRAETNDVALLGAAAIYLNSLD